MKRNIYKKRSFILVKSPVVRKRGFTLIELLLASAIFAMIMVIVVGTFSWAAGYNNRLKETRRVAQNGRLIMSEISTQVRLANGRVQFKINSADVYMGEVILLNCTDTGLAHCSLVGNTNPVRYKTRDFDNIDTNSFVSNAILILQEDQDMAILYRTVLIAGSPNFNFYKQEISWTNLSNGVLPTSLPEEERLNDSAISLRVYFGGYGPTSNNLINLNTAKKQQPFVEFYLIGETLNHDTMRPTNRARFQVKSLVETRDYN